MVLGLQSPQQRDNLMLLVSSDSMRWQVQNCARWRQAEILEQPDAASRAMMQHC